MRVLDLFSGIGGFALGLEACGMETVAFCEADGYARRVLRKHWPEAWLYDDVRTLTAKRLKADGITGIDLVCGGFPCQDISAIGKGEGIDGAKSGLWSEYARIIREVRPRWVVAENSPCLRSRGSDRVLGDLEALGYSARPLVVGAIHAGADHRRQRVWIVANADRGRLQRANSPEKQVGAEAIHKPTPQRDLRSRLCGRRLGSPGVWRAPDGLPDRAHRVRCLGNAVVPQVVEMIGRAILEADRTFYGRPGPLPAESAAA